MLAARGTLHVVSGLVQDVGIKNATFMRCREGGIITTHAQALITMPSLAVTGPVADVQRDPMARTHFACGFFWVLSRRSAGMKEGPSRTRMGKPRQWARAQPGRCSRGILHSWLCWRYCSIGGRRRGIALCACCKLAVAIGCWRLDGLITQCPTDPKQVHVSYE